MDTKLELVRAPDILKTALFNGYAINQNYN